MTASKKPISVLIVDDSALVRRTVRRLIEISPRFCVVGEAKNGAEAIDCAARLRPSVVTLDVDMPVMTGLEALPRLIREHRQRVIMLSTLTTAHAVPTFKALALGAIDFVTKPGVGAYLRNLDALGVELRRKLWIAATVSRHKIGSSLLKPAESHPIPSDAGSVARFPSLPADRVVGIGGSTGGTGPLESILAGLPTDSGACAVVVQHLPPGFSQPFARYLATRSSFDVREAANGEQLQAGRVYLAPASAHVRIQRVGSALMVRFDHTSGPVNGYRPSIDTLFFSLALAARSRSAGVVLSGMGWDGAKGLAAIRNMGGNTFCQNCASCVVPEMPRAAIVLGPIHHVVDDVELPSAIARLCSSEERQWRTAH